MAIYRVYNVGGSDSDDGSTWALAVATLTRALALATTAGDVIYVHYAHQEEVSADTTYTIGANNITIISVDKDNSDAYRAMGTDGWLGNSSGTNYYIRLAGTDKRSICKGITLRISGTSIDSFDLANSLGQHAIWEDCYFWLGTSSTSSQILTGTTSFCKLINCTFRFAATGQTIQFFKNHCEIIGGSISADGSIPTTLFSSSDAGILSVKGMDLSNITGTLVGNVAAVFRASFDRCKLGTGVTVLATQSSNPTRASAEVWLSDCNVGDMHLGFGYYNALGSVIQETGIYYGATEAHYIDSSNTSQPLSWKIVTSPNVGFATPFETPFVDLYHAGTSQITPRFEILRADSATAYKNSEVWARFIAKSTTGYTIGTESTDRQDIAAYAAGTAGSNQATGAGITAWTEAKNDPYDGGESAWSGKIDSGSAITPAENGYLSGQICVAVASATLYADPVIRTS